MLNNKEFKNPIVFQRADPWVYKHTDGYYYFTASVPEYDRIELRRATSIQQLGSVKPETIWRKHEKGEMGAHIWAPEIHFINNKWYIYFAAGDVEDIWRIRIYVLENSSQNPLEGLWVEKGQVKTNWESFSLDATTFEHKDKRYLVWAQNDPKFKNNSSLFIALMENPWTITGEQVMISRPDLEWEKVGEIVNEGPAVIKRNGKIFISYSASATDHNYCMGLLSAPETSDLLDPNSWSKSPKPIFETSIENSQYGPGHNCFTVSEDGAYDVLIYHARNYKELMGHPLTDPNRHARAQRLNWNEDGTPNFGIPEED
ncbi:glycoside hydrolase family 43 protein [Clostridium sp. C2-6-12]|uniref:glycoside hydrolase family 43 protein n=1 Tax=Clostridium sp. C2-6-12 TaxID=2698832 RepID=UPI001368591A|nr:glycoside hydrolase family 43 protein [Clostridium sp. C2-6-12]